MGMIMVMVVVMVHGDGDGDVDDDDGGGGDDDGDDDDYCDDGDASMKQLRQCVHGEQIYACNKCGHLLDHVSFFASSNHLNEAAGHSRFGIQ